MTRSIFSCNTALQYVLSLKNILLKPPPHLPIQTDFMADNSSEQRSGTSICKYKCSQEKQRIAHHQPF